MRPIHVATCCILGMLLGFGIAIGMSASAQPRYPATLGPSSTPGKPTLPRYGDTTVIPIQDTTTVRPKPPATTTTVAPAASPSLTVVPQTVFVTQPAPVSSSAAPTVTSTTNAVPSTTPAPVTTTTTVTASPASTTTAPRRTVPPPAVSPRAIPPVIPTPTAQTTTTTAAPTTTVPVSTTTTVPSTTTPPVTTTTGSDPYQCLDGQQIAPACRYTFTGPNPPSTPAQCWLANRQGVPVTDKPAFERACTPFGY